jgi:subtilisin family serine protease
MKRLTSMLSILTVLCLLSAFAAAADQPLSPKVTPKLKAWLKAHPAAEKVKAWVYFLDKGLSCADDLAAALKQREQELSPRTLWRRAKSTSGQLVDERDLEVCPNYKDQVLAFGGTHRADSRVLNAMSLETGVNSLDRIAALHFVKRIDLVKGFRRKPLETTDHAPALKTGQGSRGLNYGYSWTQLNQINVPAVHDLGFNGEGVIVCMLDTGYYKDHEVFADLDVIDEWDFINDDPETQNEPGDDPSQHNHGTYTWSALGGMKDGTLYGPAYGASFLLAKTEDITQEVPVEEDWWTEGIEWAEAKGADVASSSLAYDDWYTYQDMDGQTCVTTIAANWATEKGVVVCTAMGNNGQYAGAIMAPADSPGAISCGSVNEYGEISSFSGAGPTYDGRIKPDLCAMGENTFCAVPSGPSSYGYASGTSLSTPLIGGVAALMVDAHPDWTPEDVKEALHQTASYANNPNNSYGWGIMDSLDALYSTGFSLLDRDAFVLSESTGGQVNFFLNAGAANANRKYLLLGGLSGTSPGTPLPGGMVTLPLNWDGFTNLVINLANSTIFSNFLGTLDGSGDGQATFDTLGPLPGASGVTFYFAYALNNAWDFVSNPVEIMVVP